MFNFKFRFKARHWMLFLLVFYLLVSLPIFGIITYALIAGDLNRLFFGGMVLAGYCLAAEVFVKLAIAIDEQYLRQIRLRPDGNGRYEVPLSAAQVHEPVQFAMSMAAQVEDLEGGARGIPCDGFSRYEEGLHARS